MLLLIFMLLPIYHDFFAGLQESVPCSLYSWDLLHQMIN